MRNNYIYKYMYFLVCTVLMFSACAEEELVNEVSGKEGLPVTVSLQVTEPGDMVQASRALTAGQERHMNDLYILIFDANGGIGTMSAINSNYTSKVMLPKNTFTYSDT